MNSCERIGIVARNFQEKGFGFVLICLLHDYDLSVKCFSTVSKQSVYSILEMVAFNASSLEIEDIDIMNGMYIVKSTEELDETVVWAANYIDPDITEYLIVVAVDEEKFSAFAFGDSPMITYLAVRMMTKMRLEDGMEVNPFVPSLN